MEDAGTQVASPVVIPQPHASRFCNTNSMAKKRALPFQPSSFVYQNRPSGDWNPKSWDWDSSRFVAKPSQSDEIGVGSARSIQTRPVEVQNRSPNARNPVNIGEEDENLSLKLGGGTNSGGGMSLVEEPQTVSRPNKRVRSGSPGSSNYPMCQVDNCTEDLSTGKDYHRRHKVCGVHSKACKALVGKQMQRFCQQCSRFHPLSEFDEGKRSCRRRLAGHNRRRRKTQPEDTAPPLTVPSGRDSNSNCSLDIVNLLAILACAQAGNRDGWTGKTSTVPDRDQIVQILSTINSLPLQSDLASKLPVMKNTNSHAPGHISSENRNQEKGNASSPSTLDLLAVLSSTPASSEAFENHSQPSSEASDCEKMKSPVIKQASRTNAQRSPIQEFSSGGERSSASYRSPLEDTDCNVHNASSCLPLQLFSTASEDDGVKKCYSDGRNYLSSESSNPSEGRSPLSSPPIVHNLFPMQTSKETVKHNLLPTNEGRFGSLKATVSNGCSTSLQLFGGGSTRDTENVSIQKSAYHTGYTSSGSDHSPTSMISDVQDRTGRIVFKLIDKDPSHLPGSLRTQISNWLSNIPSEMESYIRPGCVVLILYLSMSSFAWEQFEENLLNHMRSLIQDIDAEFWGGARFLVHTEKQIASHKDGKIRLCKSCRTWGAPELISVSPLAVVRGQETSLILRGRNLTASGTEIHCTHSDAYDVQYLPDIPCEAAYDGISLDSFKINLSESSVLGRCFIEVEKNFRGCSFPVIVADNAICSELRLLEPEINGVDEVVDHIPETDRTRSREEVLHFLNELGWLFQRKQSSSLFQIPEYKLYRFQFLLTFSVEHDFCALIKTLLAILLEYSLGREGLENESLDMLAESYLLNKAVKTRSRRMVDLLIQQSVIDPINGSNKYIFLPNTAGPGGITPLHLAASTSSVDDVIDALTNDPQEMGLNSWHSVLDSNGLSPYAYALMRNNNSYNELVSRKLADRKNCQVSVSIDLNEAETTQEKAKKTAFEFDQRQSSCSKCALVTRYSRRSQVAQGLLQRPYIHSMLVVAAVCVCVCVFLRGHPDIGCVSPFAWENLGYGSM